MKGIKYDDKMLIMLYNKMIYFKMPYVYPSQLTLLEWLRTAGGLEISRRTLNRYLKRLCNSGLITRIRRVRHDVHKGLIFQTTLYSFAIVALLRLRFLGVMSKNAMKAFTGRLEDFWKRTPKKEKKGIAPGDPGFFKDFTTYGSPKREPI